MSLPEGVRIVDVAAGHWHAIFLAEDGKTYSFGRGDEGQLGRPVAEPVSGALAEFEVTGLRDICDPMLLACGEEATLVAGTPPATPHLEWEATTPQGYVARADGAAEVDEDDD